MRRILVEQARRKNGPEAGGGRRRLDLSVVDPESTAPHVDLLAMNDALDKLASVDPRAAELVKLRFFVGLTNREAAQLLGISATTAKSDWSYARYWLRAEMTDAHPSGP